VADILAGHTILDEDGYHTDQFSPGGCNQLGWLVPVHLGDVEWWRRLPLRPGDPPVSEERIQELDGMRKLALWQ